MTDAEKLAKAAEIDYENRKTEHGYEQKKQAENIQQLDDVRAQLVLNKEAYDATAETDLAELRERRDRAQAKARG